MAWSSYSTWRLVRGRYRGTARVWDWTNSVTFLGKVEGDGGEPGAPGVPPVEGQVRRRDDHAAGGETGPRFQGRIWGSVHRVSRLPLPLQYTRNSGPTGRTLYPVVLMVL